MLRRLVSHSVLTSCSLQCVAMGSCSIVGIGKGYGDWNESGQDPRRFEGCRILARNLCWLDKVVSVGRVPKSLRRNRHQKFDDPIYAYFRELEETCHKRRKKGLPSIEPREWEKGIKLVLNRMDGLSPFHIANIILCFKRARYVDEPFFEVLLGKAFRDPKLIAKFDPKQTTMTVQSLAMLARDAREGQCEAISEASFPDQDASAFVASCLHFSKVLIQSALDRNLIMENSEFSTRELSSIMHGLGLFSTSVDSFDSDTVPSEIVKDLVHAFCLKSVDLPEDDSGAQDYSNVLHGCVSLQFKDPEVLNELFDSMKRCLSREKCNVGCNSVGGICWALGEIGIRDDELLDVLVRRAKDTMSWKPRSLADMVCGLGLLGYKDEELLAEFGRFISVGHMVMSFTNRELANTVYGFGLVSFGEMEAVSVLAEEISRVGRVSTFTPKELTRTVKGLGLIGFDHDRELWCIASEIINPSRIIEFGHSEVCDIFLGFGRCKFFKPNVLKAFLTEIGVRLRELPGLELEKVLEGLVHLIPRGLDEFSTDVDWLLREMATELKFRGCELMDLRILAQISWSFEKLGFRDKKLMGYVIEQSIKQFKVAKEDQGGAVKYVSMVLVACAHLNTFVKYKREVVLASSIISENLEKLKGADWVSKCLASLAILDRLDAGILEKFAVKLVSLGMAGNLDEFDAQIWERVLFSGLIVTKTETDTSPKLSQRVLSLIERAKTESRLERPSWGKTATEAITEILKERKLLFRFGVSVVDSSIPVGCVVKGKPAGPDGIIDIESLPDVEVLPQELHKHMVMGTALLRMKALQAAGYQVLVIPRAAMDEDWRKRLDEFLEIWK